MEAAVPKSEPLATADRRRLLTLARTSIEAAVCRTAPPDPQMASFSGGVMRPAAAFVTIHEHGELRGCIGLMRFDAPLWINVRDAAAAAALNDPRFRPVVAAELPALELEISVLEQPVEIPDAAGFVSGRHGIIVERGRRRGLLLPQVATEMGWDEGQMLEAVCRKADQPSDAWRDRATRLLVFESTCFSEADLAREPAAL